MGLLVFLCLLSFVTLCFYTILLKWNEIKYRGKLGLPPGTMGWPLFGEMHRFFGQDGPNFMKTQRARYGNVFKTHILGCPTVISMDPKLNRYILLNEAKGLVPGYPKSILDILGENNISSVGGNTHQKIRGSAMFLIGPSALKEKLLPKIDKYMKLVLQNWDGKVIELQEKSQEMAFFLSFKHVFGDESRSFYEAMKQEFDKLVMGTLSLPINLPGTNYRKGLQARKKVIELVKQIIESRRSSTDFSIMDHNNDILDSLLGNHDGFYDLSEEEICDQIIMILNAGYETESTTTMMAIKYLHDHPNALKELMDEHLMIRREKLSDEPRIGWLDYKRMTFTRAVIFETMRLATIVNGVLRKTTKDIELNGYHIPEGWRIYVYGREINYDSKMYPEPLIFNPWRWLQNTSLETRKYMFLFGGGSRLCPGKELGIATISIFLHHFVTDYRWEEVGKVIISKFPRVQAPKGFHIRVMKQH